MKKGNKLIAAGLMSFLSFGLAVNAKDLHENDDFYTYINNLSEDSSYVYVIGKTAFTSNHKLTLEDMMLAAQNITPVGTTIADKLNSMTTFTFEAQFDQDYKITGYKNVENFTGATTYDATQHLDITYVVGNDYVDITNYKKVILKTDANTVFDTLVVDNGKTIDNIPVPTKEGYTFEGWYTESCIKLETTTVISSEVTYIAKFNEIVTVNVEEQVETRFKEITSDDYDIELDDNDVTVKISNTTEKVDDNIGNAIQVIVDEEEYVNKVVLECGEYQLKLEKQATPIASIYSFIEKNTYKEFIAAIAGKENFVDVTQNDLIGKAILVTYYLDEGKSTESGETEISYTIYYDGVKDLKDEVVNITDSFEKTIYNQISESNMDTILSDNESSFFVDLGAYRGTENPTELEFNGVSYNTDEVKISVGNNNFLTTPVWKIKDGHVYVAITTLAFESVPNGTTTVSVGGQDITIIVYNDVENDGIKYKNSSEIVGNSQTGYTHTIKYEDGKLVYRSGHGAQYLAFDLELNNEVIKGTDKLIFRKDLNNGTYGFTTAEADHTYAAYLPYWYNGAYQKGSQLSTTYRLVIPGYGIFDIEIDAATVVDIKDKMLSQARVFKDAYYNKAAGTELTASTDAFYMDLGEYSGKANPSELKMYGEETSTYGTNDLSFSVGNGNFISAPAWKIEAVDGKNHLFIAYPVLAFDSLPNGMTEVEIDGESFGIVTYNSDKDKELTFNSVGIYAPAANATGEATYDADTNTITFKSSDKKQALGIKLTVGNTLVEGANTLIFRKDITDSANPSFGFTTYDPGYTYVTYLLSNVTIGYSGAYTEEEAKSVSNTKEYKLAIPGYGAFTVKIVSIAIAAE